ncbi:hypothetical protein like AT5G58610 [Hibiscus trionum]|uniref:PHD finger transcription factor n=1 Tax=Hibiscus trionum TaxID=183268 RepID=A0A9W7I5G0_HIBTR|nr:hypothetical protein like AT5G58610 [Hibiscus trionum]
MACKPPKFVIEGEVCQEAVFRWYDHACTGRSGKQSELTSKAKKHLSAMGWNFWHVPKNGRRELRYQSPQGKVYYTLKAACKGYIDEISVAGGEEKAVADRNLEPKQPLKRNRSSPENQAFNESFQLQPLKREKRLKKRHIDERTGGGGEEIALAAGNLDPKQPLTWKSLFLGNQAFDESYQPQPPKLRKQENQIKPRLIKRSSLRIRKGPVLNSSQPNPKTILSWLIDKDVVLNLGKVYYRNKAWMPLKKGRITRSGIQCDCCFRVFALTAFEAHAGSSNHRPAANIILDDGSGRSLSDCQRQVRNSMTSSKVESPTNPHISDEVCSVCCDWGELICCDRCPSAFHAKCVGLKEVPDGDWFCPSCCCGICCIGILSNDDSFRACQQCERKFHVGCMRLKESNIRSDYQTGKNKWFCSRSCESIFSGLRNLTGKPIPMGKNLTWTLLKAEACTDGDTDHAYGLDNHSKLNVALDVMHECFEPSKDVYTGREIVQDVIFSKGSNLKRLDFKGFYTVIVEENDELVSVATVRVYGETVAEMPLVATRFSHRRRGMCRVLVDELEKNLAKLGVQKLILPAVAGVLDTWITTFGFSQMTGEERSKFLQYTFLDFQGTTMCQKPLRTEL